MGAAGEMDELGGHPQGGGKIGAHILDRSRLPFHGARRDLPNLGGQRLDLRDSHLLGPAVALVHKRQHLHGREHIAVMAAVKPDLPEPRLLLGERDAAMDVHRHHLHVVHLLAIQGMGLRQVDVTTEFAGVLPTREMAVDAVVLPPAVVLVGGDVFEGVVHQVPHHSVPFLKVAVGIAAGSPQRTWSCTPPPALISEPMRATPSSSERPG